MLEFYTYIYSIHQHALAADVINIFDKVNANHCMCNSKSLGEQANDWQHNLTHIERMTDA